MAGGMARVTADGEATVPSNGAEVSVPEAKVPAGQERFDREPPGGETCHHRVSHISVLMNESARAHEVARAIQKVRDTFQLLTATGKFYLSDDVSNRVTTNFSLEPQPVPPTTTPPVATPTKQVDATTRPVFLLLLAGMELRCRYRRPRCPPGKKGLIENRPAAKPAITA
jgi:hypothetical protein